MNLRRHLIIAWIMFGVVITYKDFKKYYARMSQPQPDVNYEEYFVFKKLKFA